MKVKQLALAAAMVVSAPAFAALDATNNPKLWAVVWDDAFGSFVIDFNVRLDTVLGNAAGTYTLGTTTGSAAWASYRQSDLEINDFAANSGTRVAFFAIDADGSIFDADDSVLYYTTLQGNFIPTAEGQSLGALIGSIGLDYIPQANVLLPASIALGGDFYAANNTPQDYNENIQGGGAFGIYGGNAVGTTNRFYRGSTTVFSTGDPNAPVTFAGTPLSFGFNGTNFVATVVPEPETYLLWLAGLSTVAFVALRRKG